MDNFRRNSSQNLIFSPNCCDHKKACSGAPFEFRRYPFRSKALGLSQTHKRMHTQSYVKVVVKATFHYSSQLFSTRFAARFSTSSCGFATCFRHAFDFLSKIWSRTCCINLDMSILTQQVCSRFVGSCAC